MVKELKAKWCKALRSGKFKQGKGRLKTKYGFCCLGVLRHVVNPKDTRTTGNGLLVGDFALECGLDDETQRKLACLNDGNEEQSIKRHSFRQIAAYIAKNL